MGVSICSFYGYRVMTCESLVSRGGMGRSVGGTLPIRPAHGLVIHLFVSLFPSPVLRNRPRSIPYFRTRYARIRLVVPSCIAALFWLPPVCSRAETMMRRLKVGDRVPEKIVAG